MAEPNALPPDLSWALEREIELVGNFDRNVMDVDVGDQEEQPATLPATQLPSIIPDPRDVWVQPPRPGEVDSDGFKYDYSPSASKLRSFVLSKMGPSTKRSKNGDVKIVEFFKCLCPHCPLRVYSGNSKKCTSNITIHLKTYHEAAAKRVTGL